MENVVTIDFDDLVEQLTDSVIEGLDDVTIREYLKYGVTGFYNDDPEELVKSYFNIFMFNEKLVVSNRQTNMKYEAQNVDEEIKIDSSILNLDR
jgi:hypothetical protein